MPTSLSNDLDYLTMPLIVKTAILMGYVKQHKEFDELLRYFMPLFNIYHQSPEGQLSREESLLLKETAKKIGNKYQPTFKEIVNLFDTIVSEIKDKLFQSRF